MNHKYSTYAIIGMIIVAGIIIATGLDTKDLDDVCSTNNMTLFRYNGVWSCGSLQNMIWTNITNITNVYNNYSTECNNTQFIRGLSPSAYNYSNKADYNFMTNIFNGSGNFYTTGNIGIGNASAGTKLDVYLNTGVTTGTQTTYIINLRQNGSNLAIGSDASYWYIQSFNSKPLNINPAGNNIILAPASATKVGVGQTSPKAKLEITGNLMIGANSTNYVCNSTLAGSIYYDGTLNKHYGCNSTTWVALY